MEMWMSYYAITKIRYDAQGIERVMLHEIDLTGANEYSLGEGIDTPVADVANLLRGGDRVIAMVERDDGTYDKADEVRVAPQSDDLLSVAIIGRESTRLQNLPQY
jgi:hypothetical protein